MIDSALSNKWLEGKKQQKNPLPFSYRTRGLVVWEEHCVECSPPYCYHHCENYLERVDKKCIRMVGGIQRVKGVSGSLPYGVYCHFRKWAKLESRFSNKSVGDGAYKLADVINRALGKTALVVAKIARPLSPTLKPYGAYVALRHWIMDWNWCQSQELPDVFFIRCSLKEKESVQLLIQMESKESIIYSQIHTLKKGENEILIQLVDIKDRDKIIKTFISPLEDSETKIEFSYIDYFYGIRMYENQQSKPAQKVKVVAWDLDNTLWDGTLVEDEDVRVRNSVVECIKQLDSKGILNTIVSKNDHDKAWKKVEDFGIAEYFLAPAINWGQKSENLKGIAKYLNLGIDAFAFVDDNVREREEVKMALPMVRVYSDEEVSSLLNLPEFDVPVTEASKTRRLSYQQEVSRKQFEAQFTDNYDEYLRSLEMLLTVELINESNTDRCFELLSRSNQLNLSTNRYTQGEYIKLINDPDNLCYSFRCRDKFGDYGIVAFLSLHLDGNMAVIKDFVISCRVEKKKVEEACICSLREVLKKRGISQISAKLIKTKKNGPIAAVFDDLPFKIVRSDNASIDYLLESVDDMVDRGIVKCTFSQNKGNK